MPAAPTTPELFAGSKRRSGATVTERQIDPEANDARNAEVFHSQIEDARSTAADGNDAGLLDAQTWPSRPMTTYVALFRGINVGGRTAKMALLRSALEHAGFADVATYIQSGNLVVTSDSSAAEVAADIESVFQATFGYASRVSLRSAAEWRRLIVQNPFPQAAGEPKRLHAVLLDAAPPHGASEALAAVAGPSERFSFGEGVLYLHTPDGFGTSRLAASLDRLLKVPLTARNWRTVLVLDEMAGKADG